MSHVVWIPQTEAARRLDASVSIVRRLIKRGQLSVRAIPGTHPRVSATDLDRLISEHTRQAAALDRSSEEISQGALLRPALRVDTCPVRIPIPA